MNPFIGVGRRKRCSVDDLSNFLRNFQTSSYFYQSCSHGLIQSSHQAFNYPKLLRDRSKDGLHVAGFSLLDSWSLGNKLIEFISNFLPLNSQGRPLFLRSKRKLHLISFLLGPKAFADNDLSAVECTQTDRVTLKNWNASCIVNYSRTSHTLIIQLLSFPTPYLLVVSNGKWSAASKAWHSK